MKTVVLVIILNVMYLVAQQDSAHWGSWTADDLTNVTHIGDFTTDSIEFIPNFKPNEAILRLFYTASHGSLAGQYALAMNIKGFAGPGVYQFGNNEGRWRAMDGTVCGVQIASGDGGSVRILYYDAVNKIVAGDFDLYVTGLLTSGDEVNFHITKGNFKMGRPFLITNIKNEPIREKEFKVLKVEDQNDPVKRKSLGKLTTSKSGWLYIPKVYDIKPDDLFLIQAYLDTVLADKRNHDEVDKIKYYTKIDNISFDKDGKPDYDTVRFAPTADTILIGHQTIIFNLLISIEWNAKEDYFSALSQWLRQLGDYYYDVSDGQLEFDKIAIYDNRKYWDDADIQIFTSNNQWPESFFDGINSLNLNTHFPRMFGSEKREINYLNTAKPNWLSLDNGYMSRTIGHELGHYALGFRDEYMNNAGQNIHNNYNYGFMDNEYPAAGEFSSEMSSILRYPDASFKDTRQWVFRTMDCWAYIEKQYEKIRKDIFCPIIIPTERTLVPGKDYQVGPNENGVIDLKIGDNIKIKTFNEGEGARGNYTWIVNIPNENTHKVHNWGKSISVTLIQKMGNTIIGNLYQGVANTDSYSTAPPSGYDNTMIILDARIGDEARGEWKYYQNNTATGAWVQTAFGSSSKTITEVSIMDKKSDYPQLLENKSELITQLDDDQKFVGNWKYTQANKMDFHLTCNNQQSNPEIEMEYSGKEFGSIQLNKDGGGFFTTIDKELSSEGIHWLKIKNKAYETIYSSIKGQIMGSSSDYFSRGGTLWVSIDTTLVKIQKMGIFSTMLPALTDGLTNVQLQVSDVFSLASYPHIDKFPESTNNFLLIHYDKGMIPAEEQQSLHIFHWNETNKRWNIMESSVDTVMGFVTSPLRESGSYVLFLTDLKVGIDDKLNDINHYGISIGAKQVITNDIDYAMVKSANDQNVTIGLFDIFGNEVIQVFKGFISQGEKVVKINTSGLPSGVYFIRAYGESSSAVYKILKCNE